MEEGVLESNFYKKNLERIAVHEILVDRHTHTFDLLLHITGQVGNYFELEGLH